MHNPDGQTLAVPTGKHCNNCGAEMRSYQTASTAKQTASRDYHQSVLETLSNSKEPQLTDAIYIARQEEWFYNGRLLTVVSLEIRLLIKLQRLEPVTVNQTML